MEGLVLKYVESFVENQDIKIQDMKIPQDMGKTMI